MAIKNQFQQGNPVKYNCNELKKMNDYLYEYYANQMNGLIREEERDN